MAASLLFVCSFLYFGKKAGTHIYGTQDNSGIPKTKPRPKRCSVELSEQEEGAGGQIYVQTCKFAKEGKRKLEK